VFGLSGEKLLILGLLAVFILGPERLPGYAKSLANLVKSLRKMTENAKTQLKEELGDEYEEAQARPSTVRPASNHSRSIDRRTYPDQAGPQARSATPKGWRRSPV
jgi:sec-independent protein translocase protein TatB